MRKKLPVVTAPTIVIELPISKIKVKYRPFIIKEQKALLLAQESRDKDTVIETIKSVILSCSDGTFDFSKVPTADLAYFFIQLRIASVGPDVRFQIQCTSCSEQNVVGMSLSDVNVSVPDNFSNRIAITPTVGIVFRIPTIDDAFDATRFSDRSIGILYNLIDSIYDEDSVYQKSDYSEQEFIDWIETFNDKQLLEINNFVKSIPKLSHTLTFNCTHCGHEQSRILEGLQNFFRFGINT